MADITYFIALPFDFVDGGIAAGEPIKCPNPAAAIQSAEGLWKIFGHTGAVCDPFPQAEDTPLLHRHRSLLITPCLARHESSARIP
jgi:hypothetical protein